MEATDDGLRWRKARASSAENGCVEVGTLGGHAAGIRDSKSPERGHLAVTPEMLGALLGAVKAGQLDLRLGVGAWPPSWRRCPSPFVRLQSEYG
jgi:hypothetical protein